ncbi:uncharacterized protein [Venturia canescens]|uniref:uncharacterized protein n=1 Tax=Venturia canescens TaxID=32260 RepID=UPI001C9C5B55|nr:uncharacterized protein LOC122414760 [Venturia canescens]
MSVNKMSGAKRRKLAKEKQEKESLIAKKIPRIDHFFIHHETAEEATHASSSATTEDSSEKISRLHEIVGNEKEEKIVDEVTKLTNTGTSAAEIRGNSGDDDDNEEHSHINREPN